MAAAVGIWRSIDTAHMCLLVQIVVNAIVDTLKTAFPRSEPQSPTEDNETEVDGGKIGADKKTR